MPKTADFAKRVTEILRKQELNRRFFEGTVLPYFGGRIVSCMHDEIEIEVAKEHAAAVWRILAHLGKGADPYRAFAAGQKNVEPEAITAAERAEAKRALFGFRYGERRR